MTKIMRVLKQRWFVMGLVCLMSFGAFSMAGCAGSTKTSTTTTQTTGGTSDSGSTTTVTTQKETSAHPRGVIGGLFYVIGQVLIWPFKVIGSLF